MLQFEDNAPYRWKTVRLFISSTFRDFHAERDYLIKYVFPDLRQWSQQWRLHLVDIDLRWGVTQQEAESGKVIDICLEQIDQCRPFFICMLGNRYGWVPDTKKLLTDSRERYDRIRGKEHYSVTHLEIHYAIMAPFLPLDLSEQVVPHAFFYFRDESSLPSPQNIDKFTDKQRKEYFNTFFEVDNHNRHHLQKLKKTIIRHYEELGRKRGNPNEVK